MVQMSRATLVSVHYRSSNEESSGEPLNLLRDLSIGVFDDLVRILHALEQYLLLMVT
jgi:hypothetical protein